MVPLTFIIGCIFIVGVFLSEASTSQDAYLAPCEQMVVNTGQLRSDDIGFTANGFSHAALFYTAPPISTTKNTTVDRDTDRYIWYDDYHYWSFNLVANSVLYWNIRADGVWDEFDFYLLRGMSNFKDWKNGYSYDYVDRKYYISSTNSSMKASYSDEYFLVIEAPYNGVTVDSVFTVEHTRYLIEENPEKTCDGSCTLYVDVSHEDNAMVIVEKDCSSVSTDHVTVTYYEPFSTVFYVCVVFACIIGLAFIASLIACIGCALRGNKGSQGQTYANVPSTATATTTLPAGNVTPVAATPSYQQTPAYNPVPPAYAAVDPSAPTYVPYNTPTATYGTAPTAY